MLANSFVERYLRQRLGEEIERAKSTSAPLSVLAIDLDRFQHVNASYGRSVGDRVLALFADQVRALMRPFDVLVRIGGDDFAIVLPASGAIETQAFAERLAKHVAESPIEPMAGAFITQSISVGAATWDGAESAEDFDLRVRARLDDAKSAKPDA